MAYGIADQFGKNQSAGGELIVIGVAAREQAAKIFIAHRVGRT